MPHVQYGMMMMVMMMMMMMMMIKGTRGRFINQTCEAGCMHYNSVQQSRCKT